MSEEISSCRRLSYKSTSVGYSYNVAMLLENMTYRLYKTNVAIAHNYNHSIEYSEIIDF